MTTRSDPALAELRRLLRGARDELRTQCDEIADGYAQSLSSAGKLSEVPDDIATTRRDLAKLRAAVKRVRPKTRNGALARKACVRALVHTDRGLRQLVKGSRTNNPRVALPALTRAGREFQLADDAADDARDRLGTSIL